LSRKELINKLKKNYPKFNIFELNNIINIFCESIVEALIKKHNVEIRDFGSWKMRKLKENYNARNPKTNQLIYKPERVKIRFKAAKKLNEIINE